MNRGDRNVASVLILRSVMKKYIKRPKPYKGPARQRICENCIHYFTDWTEPWGEYYVGYVSKEYDGCEREHHIIGYDEKTNRCIIISGFPKIKMKCFENKEQC